MDTKDIYLQPGQKPKRGFLGNRKQLRMKTVPASVNDIWRVPLILTNAEREYLRERFFSNNHPKYRKYCDEWISGIMLDQLTYFMREAERIGWKYQGCQGQP